MRYLSKIVFINSAHIRHEIIPLDGNVHFIGTQGFGKSTILRALLFFYNADKQHLGIRQGQQSFDEFYFPHANSYIVYEVAREYGAYTILVHRHQGRAVFRFIDAPYSDGWLIDDKGEVTSDWVTIRQRIVKGGADISAVIDRYEMYRDIIFGNTHDRAHKFDKYAIIESSKYQNIPRSIQNVFLNSKLDADFVKDTIIHSMTNGETVLNLQAFRSLIKRFESEYKDIHCWYAKDKNGDIAVRIKANTLIERYREVVATEHQITQIWKQLNTAVAKAREQLPLDEQELQTVREQIEKISKKLREAQETFEKEKDLINRHIGELDGKLRTIREKKKKYDSLHIEMLLERAKNESALKSIMEQEKMVYNSLIKTYSDIEDKYKIQKLTIEHAHKAFEISLKEELNYERNQLQMQREKLTAEKEKEIKRVRNEYNNELVRMDECIEAFAQERVQLQETITKIQYSHPLEDMIKNAKEELQNLNMADQSGAARIQAVDSEIACLRSEANAEQKRKHAEFDNKRSELTAKEKALQERLTKIEEKLSQWSGSFYEWLTINKPDWEQNIGKVVDEDKILYQVGLNPTLVDGDSLYGIKIDCNTLDTTHHTQEEYRKEKEQLVQQLSDIHSQLSGINLLQEEADERISIKLSKDLAPLNQEKTTLRVELENIPNKRRLKETEILRIQREEAEQIAVSLSEKNEMMNTLIMKISAKREDKNKVKLQLDKEENRLEKALKEAIKPYVDRLDTLNVQQEQRRQDETKEYQDKINTLQKEYNRELVGRGADTSIIEHQKTKIEEIKEQLKRIEECRRIVVSYNIDNEEWFSQESRFITDRKQYEDKLNVLSEAHREKQNRHYQKQTELKSAEDSCVKQIQRYQDGLEQYRRFVDIEKGVPEYLLYETHTNVTNKDIQTLLSEEKGAISTRHSRFTSFKMTVNQFNSHFESENLFSFNTLPVQDEDYIGIATNLEEFVTQNKIEEYRIRTNALYKDVIQRVAREVGNLTQHKADVDKIILDINRDFSEKKFAGVIRSIELRSEQTNDKMMQLLQSIKQFTEEHALSLGEINLFSGEDRNEINEKVVDYLSRLMKQLQHESARAQISIGDTFCLQFRVRENDNDTGWVERINSVGSDGTDILVKAMINIMLINVFKKRATRGKDDFIVHCMMDEIGKLHPDNIHGILQFANSRNIYLVNGSPTTENAYDYKYTYMLEKVAKAYTKVSCLSIVHKTE